MGHNPFDIGNCSKKLLGKTDGVREGVRERVWYPITQCCEVSRRRAAIN